MRGIELLVGSKSDKYHNALAETIFNDWLARAAQTGLVTGAHRLRPS